MPFPTGQPGDLDQTVAEVEKHGRRCVAIEADVRSTISHSPHADLDDVVAHMRDTFARLPAERFPLLTALIVIPAIYAVVKGMSVRSPRFAATIRPSPQAETPS